MVRSVKLRLKDVFTISACMMKMYVGVNGKGLSLRRIKPVQCTCFVYPHVNA
jgi:hypothetical protein